MNIKEYEFKEPVPDLRQPEEQTIEEIKFVLLGSRMLLTVIVKLI
mgnify:CR=1 FL=1